MGLIVSKGGVVTLSADKLLEIADKIKTLESELRQLGLSGLDIKSTTRAPQRQTSKTEAMPLAFDVSNLDWQKSNRDGGGPAGEMDGWAWCFAYPDADSPDPRTECYQLVEALIQYGEIQCGKYLIKLAGRDNRLLNRKLA